LPTPNVNAAHFEVRDACPVCFGHDATVFYSAPFDSGPVRGFIESHYATQGRIDWSLLQGTDFALAGCPVCDLIYQVAVPNDALLENIYTRMINADFLRPLEQQMLTLPNFHQVAGELSVLFELIGKPCASIRFLDYGFGYGRWARVARAMGAEVFATEIGDDKAQAAADIGITMIDDSQVDEMRFDIVHTEQVFEHLPDPHAKFRRLAAVTDGILKVAVPRGGPIRELLKSQGMAAESPFARGRLSREDRAYVGVQPLEHLNLFSPRTMRWLATDAGMRIVSTTRRSMTTIDLRGFAAVKDAAARVAKSVARDIVKPNTGYYLFAPQ
jgi:hypothetical protein